MFLSGSLHCGAVDGIGSGLVGAAVGCCFTVVGGVAAAVATSWDCCATADEYWSEVLRAVGSTHRSQD